MTPEEFYKSQLGSPIPDDILRRIKQDAEMVGFAFDQGKGEALRTCAEAMRVQADLCDRGIAPTADLLRCWAAVWDHEAGKYDVE